MMVQRINLLPLLCGAALLLSNSVAGASSNLRAESSQQRELDNIASRRLQDNSTTTEMIQAEINEALPGINFDMRRALEDPIDLDLTASVPLGCGSLALRMEFEKLTGLSTINVNSITLQDGTDSTTLNCNILTAWKTAADVVVSFGSNLVSGGITSRVVGTCGGITYNQPLSTSVTATNVGFNGVANMEGTFGPVANNINRADILGTLALTTTSIAASVSLFPPALSAYLATATTQLEAAFRTQLVKDIEPLVRNQLERKIPSRLLFSVFDNLIGNALPMIYELFTSFLGGSD